MATKQTTQQDVDYKSAMQQISSLLAAKVPYIWINTYEEDRLLQNLYMQITNKQKREMWVWSSYLGIKKFDPEKLDVQRASGDWDKTWVPPQALQKIQDYQNKTNKRGSIWVMKDFHTCLTQPVPRQMRDMYYSLIQGQKTIIIVSPHLAHGPSGTKPGMEPTLDKQITVVGYELPSREEVEQRVIESIAALQDNKHKKGYKGAKVDYSDKETEHFVTALQGLTETEIDNALATSFTHLRRIDEKKLLLEKKQIVQRSEILEYIGQAPPMSEVGGLDAAKTYFDTYSSQFSQEAKAYGVEPLKGVLLTGVPGTGKSLLAKAIAALWNLPLLRLDVGKVMTGLVGGSEEKMRAVIGQVEAIAPCILWIDEIEKSLSGTKSSNFSDGGTLSRVFGTLLTAMEERMENVVIIATANDIQALPPELIRRFNEVMFVDLPVPSEREEIFNIHLKKRGREISKLNLDMKELVALTHLYTGSEIEKAVKESIARAFRTKQKDVGQHELKGAVVDTKCIAKVMKEKIDEIRDWARDKARYASTLAAEAAGSGKQKVTTLGGRELDLDSDLDDIEETVDVPVKKKKKATVSELVEELD